MTQALTLDNAIEILEITDISKITIHDLPKIKKKAQLRWHPDKIAATNPSDETLNHYKETFQKIEDCIEVLRSFLNGNYQAGEKYEGKQRPPQPEPEEVIRQNASSIQAKMKEVWKVVKSKAYKHMTKEVLVADGFKLKDLLMEDLKDDAPTISLASFFFGFYLMIPLMLVGVAIPFLGVVVGIFWAVQALSCFLIFLPLSRIWLPQEITDIALKFVNLGMNFRDWVMNNWGHNNWVAIFFSLPILFAKAVKYVLLYPIYFIAGEILKEKVVGEVRENVNYYAGLADWYVEGLIDGNANEFTSEQLFDLSYLYTELSDVPVV